eukprot:713435-Rhodomonas_salina.2
MDEIIGAVGAKMLPVTLPPGGYDLVERAVDILPAWSAAVVLIVNEGAINHALRLVVKLPTC